ncbi:MAG: SGNH/GDSL hydrolase family protein, partial [Thermoleophilia bacterium]|nr:SGNH/GDSL hydrolase family protein [Thermoleophilia bacterium]
MRSFGLAAVAMVATLAPCAPASAGFSSVYTFGDSISDTGNVFAATGTPGAPYFNGRFSNGPVWVEVLAGRLGVAAPTPSLAGGTNFAWGGAQTGTGLSPLGTPNLGTQVGGFVTGGGTLTAANLVTITAGGNDFLGGVTNPLAPVDNIAAALTALAGAGGRSFAITNLPRLGQIPETAALPQAQRDALDALTLTFNGLLSGRIAQLRTLLNVDIALVDLDGLIQEVRANPAGFGFTNTTGSALANGVVSGQGYLFWDNVHVTAAGHQIIGNRAFALVPEPSSAALMAAAV